MDPSVIARPELTFSPEVADFARKACAKAGIILEYGRGSSTVLASEMERKTVFSVESDKRWATNLQACLDQAGTCPPVPPASHLDRQDRQMGAPRRSCGLSQASSLPHGGAFF